MSNDEGARRSRERQEKGKMMAEVALIRCESYDRAAVRAACERGLALLGGAAKFVKNGEHLLLKPNLIAADPPERASTTHPEVFRAIAELFIEAGARLSYGDSPGIGGIEAATKKSGIADVANELRIPLGDFVHGEEVTCPTGVQNKKFYIVNAAREADGIVSLPKFKTHALEKYTGAVKNQLGCVPGLLKGEWHVRLPDAHDFGKMLVDLNSCLAPRLYVMDAIVAMEGNGPRGGTPRALNVLFFSTDPVALDATACRMVNLNPGYVPTNVHGAESNAGVMAEEEITILGESIESFFDPDFDIVREPTKSRSMMAKLGFLKGQMTPRPTIIDEKCIRCGICVKSCPAKPKAVDWFKGDRKKAPTYSYPHCIRCYCCQEMCPESAIVLRLPLLRRVFNRLFVR